MLQTIHDKLKGWLAGVVLGSDRPGVRVLGHQLDVERPQLRRQSERRGDLQQRRAPGLSAPARPVRAPGQRAAETMRERTDLKRRVLEDYVNSRGAGHPCRRPRLPRERPAAARRDGAASRSCKWTANSIYAHALAMLKAQGRSIAQIEDMFRRDVKLRQLDERDQRLELRRRRPSSSGCAPSRASNASSPGSPFRRPSYAAEATPDDAAVKAYYDAHKSQYMTPETVNLRYVELSLAELATKVQRRRCAAQDLLRRAEGEDAGALHAGRAAPRAAHPVPGRGPEGRCGGQGQGRRRSLKRAQSGEDFAQARAGAFAGHRAPRRRAATSAGRSARRMSARSPMPPSA